MEGNRLVHHELRLSSVLFLHAYLGQGKQVSQGNEEGTQGFPDANQSGMRASAVFLKYDGRGDEMSMLKILNINAYFIRQSAHEDFASELNNEIEEKRSTLNNMEKLPYDKSDMAKLINSMENCKMKCLKGEISAKRLYRDVDYARSLFRIKHPGFDYMKDPALNAYYA